MHRWRHYTNRSYRESTEEDEHGSVWTYFFTVYGLNCIYYCYLSDAKCVLIVCRSSIPTGWVHDQWCSHFMRILLIFLAMCSFNAIKVNRGNSAGCCFPATDEYHCTPVCSSCNLPVLALGIYLFLKIQYDSTTMSLFGFLMLCALVLQVVINEWVFTGNVRLLIYLLVTQFKVLISSLVCTGSYLSGEWFISYEFSRLRQLSPAGLCADQRQDDGEWRWGGDCHLPAWVTWLQYA